MTSNANAQDLYETVEWALRGASEELAAESEAQSRVLTLTPLPAASAATAAAGGKSTEATDVAARRDWGSAITLVQEAAEAIRYREERIEELRRESEEQTQQHLADLKAMHAQLLAAQKEIEAANARANAAETKAKEANEWLAKLHDAITGNLATINRL